MGGEGKEGRGIEREEERRERDPNQSSRFEAEILRYITSY